MRVQILVERIEVRILPVERRVDPGFRRDDVEGSRRGATRRLSERRQLSNLRSKARMRLPWIRKAQIAVGIAQTESCRGVNG